MQQLFRNVSLAFIMTALSAIGTHAADAAFDWPNFRGPNHDGISKDTKWNPKALSAAKIAWKTNVGKGYSAFSVKGDVAFTMGNNGKEDVVYCLKLQDGSEVWKTPYACEPAGGGYAGPRTTPALDGKFVYTLSNMGHLLCIDSATGTIKWQKNIMSDFQAQNIKWGFSGSPRVEKNMLIINAGLHGLALNKDTGEKIWSSPAGKGGYSTPVIYKGSTGDSIALFGEKAAFGADLKTGRQLWSYDWVTSYDVNAADPIVAGTKVFISSGYDKGCALLDISGPAPKVIWNNKNMRNHFSSCVLIGEYIYGIDGNTGKGSLKCIELASGAQKWSQDLGFGALMAVNDKLVILNENGSLFIAEASPAAYSEISSAKGILGKTCWTMPVVCRGMILCRNNQGDIACVDVSK